MTPESPTPAFLRLPLELRYSVYDALCTPTSRSYPLRAPSPITAASLIFTPLSLLLTNRHLATELSTYYFTRCTFRFVAQSFSSRATDRPHISHAALHVVRHMRRAELLLLPGTMKATPSDPWPSVMIKSMAPGWLGEQVGLLRHEAGELRTVVVSIRRVSWDHAWSMEGEMGALLEPLAKLRGRVKFEIGEVTGPAAIEDSMRRALVALLERLNG